MADIPTRTLPTGKDIPHVGFGTYNIPGENVTEVVRTALDAGYRHVDCAEGYKNEAGVSTALADYDREELFVTSKVIPSNLNYENVLSACEDSLDRLETSYLDLYLIHWPNPAISLRETLDAMATLQEGGLVRHVGVSNFNLYQLKFARRIADVPISVVQTEIHPWFQQEQLVAYCEEHGIVPTAAAPLGRTRVFEDETVQAVAKKHDTSPASVILRWQIENDVVPIPRSTTDAHIRSNVDLFDWALDPEDIARIDEIGRWEKIYTIEPDHDTYGISR